MQDVVRKRLVGAAVLIALGIIVPLLLARWLHDPVADGQAMRVYEITPSGGVERVAADNEPNAAADDAAASNMQAAEDSQSPDQQLPAATELATNEQTPSLPEIKPQQPDSSEAPEAEQTRDAGEPPDSEQAASDEATTAAPEADSETRAPSPERAAAPADEHAEPAQADGQSEAQEASEPEPAADSGLQRSVATGDWIVQVASFGKKRNAEALAKALGSDFSAFYTAAEVNGETWYRVRIGPLNSEAAADNVASELHAQGHNTLVLQID